MAEYPTAHARGRRISDQVLRTWTVKELYDLAGQCDIEPTDNSGCDACAAYLIALEKDDITVDRAVDRLAHEFVLGATDASAQHPLAVPIEENEVPVAVQLQGYRDYIASLERTVDQHRPWLFVPGDRVIVLIGAKMEGATVQQIRIPGPIHENQVVQVMLDEPLPGQQTAMWWFDPDQVERLSR